MPACWSHRKGIALAFVAGVVVAGAGTATAARLITGKQIKDGSIGTSDLSKAVRRKLDTASGPAGGALAGRYPNPTIRRAVATRIAQQPAAPAASVDCTVTFNVFCGQVSDGVYWSRQPGATPLTYLVDQSGWLQFESVALAINTNPNLGVIPVAPNLMLTLPPGRRPASEVSIVVPWSTPGGLRGFGIVSVEPDGSIGAVIDDATIGIMGVPNTYRLDLSAVRFRIG